MIFNLASRPRKSVQAFTLAEVVICILVALVAFAGIITAYTQAAFRAEWAGYNLAAQAAAVQQLEQAKAAVWDNSVLSQKDEITNIQRTASIQLDVPINGTNITWATNYATVTQFTISGTTVKLYLVKVDTVWPFVWKGLRSYYTNSVADYYAPDTPDS